MSQDIFSSDEQQLNDAVDEAASLTPAPSLDTNSHSSLPTSQTTSSHSSLPTTSQTNTNTYRPRSPQYSEPVNRSVSSVNDANAEEDRRVAGEWERLLYVASQVTERELSFATLEEEETAPLLLNEISPSQSSSQRSTITTEFRVESNVDNLNGDEYNTFVSVAHGLNKKVSNIRNVSMELNRFPVEHDCGVSNGIYNMYPVIKRDEQIIFFFKNEIENDDVDDDDESFVNLTEQEAKERILCKICFEDEIGIVFMPCGHNACRKCLIKLYGFEPKKAEENRCPFCRKIVVLTNRLCQ
ncbi:uncharacterized protein LOC142323286 [Lycorma delicatula]|uniref:uncharacterized protein LOC142323286 n=1 Tax=Lycorma delicatula TaxID=130591 RepID=UPI003F511EB8